MFWIALVGGLVCGRRRRRRGPLTGTLVPFQPSSPISSALETRRSHARLTCPATTRTRHHTTPHSHAHTHARTHASTQPHALHAASVMDRSLSVDDFAGGVWRLGHAGLGRNDSESQFADLLKSFPSTNSLGGEAGGNGGGNEAGGTGGDAAQPGAAGGGDGTAGGRVVGSEGNGGAGGMGMPRVASLEVLKQFLVGPQQLAQSVPGVKKDAGGWMGSREEFELLYSRGGLLRQMCWSRGGGGRGHRGREVQGNV